jgi:hypothetical protein
MVDIAMELDDKSKLHTSYKRTRTLKKTSRHQEKNQAQQKQREAVMIKLSSRIWSVQSVCCFPQFVQLEGVGIFNSQIYTVLCPSIYLESLPVKPWLF